MRILMIAPEPFFTTAQGFSVARGTALPTLNLSRVFVLTGRNTCSASESVINSLRGVNVEVIQIGSTTCGKPYGFYPQDNPRGLQPVTRMLVVRTSWYF